MLKFKVINVLTIVLTCNGHLRLFGDILSSTHEKIHSTVHDVAGGLLGGLSHGINLNFNSHIGINQRRPDPGFQQQNEYNSGFQQQNEYNSGGFQQQNGYNPGQSADKVVVIIQEEDKYNQRPPPPPPPPDAYQQQRPTHYNGYRPGNNQESGYDNSQEHGNYNNHQSNYVNPNNHGNQFNQGNNYVPPVTNQYNTDRPHIPENNVHQEINYGSINTPVTENTEQPINPDKVTTKNPGKDEPFFIPLNPNEYVYGGDKINITEPKRETQKQIEDGVGQLDIRFNND